MGFKATPNTGGIWQGMAPDQAGPRRLGELPSVGSGWAAPHGPPVRPAVMGGRELGGGDPEPGWGLVWG